VKGHRRRDPAEDGESLLVEFLDDEGDLAADAEVDIGSPPPSGRRPLVAGAAVAAALAVLAGMTVFGRDDQTASPPAPTTAPPAVTTTVAPTTTFAGTVRVASAGPSTYRLATVPLVATDQPWSLYLRTADGSNLYEVDVTTGWATPVEDTTGLVVKVLPGIDGPVIADQRRSAQSPLSWATGPDGNVWIPDSAGTALQLVHVTGGLEVLVTTIAIGPQEHLIGSTALGEPVVSGPDERQYRASPGGRRERIADGFVNFVENGSFAELRCDVAQQCVVLAHGAAVPAPLELRYRRGQAYRFSPSGTHVALVDERRAEIVDLATGATVVSLEADLPPQRIEVPAGVAWSPDSRYLVVSASDGQLYVLDAQTASMRPSDLPPALSLGVPLALL
jgi:hypothetical protein